MRLWGLYYKFATKQKTWVHISTRLLIEALGKPWKITNRVFAHVGIYTYPIKVCMRI